MTNFGNQVATIEGKKTALGPLCRDHLPLFWQWFNDLDVMRTYGPRLSPMAWETLEEWYKRAINETKTVAFTVYDRSTQDPVGYTMLVNINYHHRIADFDIIIGDKSKWGQGIGTEATALTVDYGFVALGLHNIMLTVRSFNQAGVRAYEKAGFREFGRRKEARRFGEQAYDLIYMECLATNFQSPKLTELLPER